MPTSLLFTTTRRGLFAACVLAAALGLSACDDGGPATTPTDDTSTGDVTEPSDTATEDSSTPDDTTDTTEPDDTTEPTDTVDTTDPGDATDVTDTTEQDVVMPGCESLCQAASLPPGELRCDNEDPSQICQVVSCAGTGNDDCNAEPTDGCEQPLDEVAACGACGNDCAALGGVADSACTAGACEIVACADGVDDCNVNAADGCEQALDAPEACGSCANDCTALPNVAETSCAQDGCAIVSCAAGFEDCNADPADGCEADTTADPAHCGGCGMACQLDNVETYTCSSGTCGIDTCAEGFDDCDSTVGNGCEQDIYWSEDGTNCGACGNTCSLPNADTTECKQGVCLVRACMPGRLEGNLDPVDGCEVSVVRGFTDEDILTPIDASLIINDGSRPLFSVDTGTESIFYYPWRYQRNIAGAVERQGIVGSRPGADFDYEDDSGLATDWDPEKIRWNRYSSAVAVVHGDAGNSVPRTEVFFLPKPKGPGTRNYGDALIASTDAWAWEVVHDVKMLSDVPVSAIDVMYLTLHEGGLGEPSIGVHAVGVGSNLNLVDHYTQRCESTGLANIFTHCKANVSTIYPSAIQNVALGVVEIERSPNMRAIVFLAHGINVATEFFLLEVGDTAPYVTFEAIDVNAPDGSDIFLDDNPFTAMPAAGSITSDDGFVQIYKGGPSLFRFNLDDTMCQPHGICSLELVARGFGSASEIIAVDHDTVIGVTPSSHDIVLMSWDATSPYAPPAPWQIQVVMGDDSYAQLNTLDMLDRGPDIAYDPYTQRVYFLNPSDNQPLYHYQLSGL